MSIFWLCADDYGLSEGVGVGVRRLFDTGRLSAVSAMATSPLWPREARALHDLGARGQVGLHFDLTHFPPLGRLLKLAPAGTPASLRRLIAAALLKEAGGQDLVDEFRRQLDRFETEFGAPPDFVDGHQHAHAFPGVRDALFTALLARGYSSRPWIRVPSDRVDRILRRRLEAPKALAVAVLAAGFDPSAFGFSQNEGFAGFTSFDPRGDVASEFARHLTAAGKRHLVMCHPGAGDLDAAGDPLAPRRRRELDFLASGAFEETLAARRFSLSYQPIFMRS